MDIERRLYLRLFSFCIGRAMEIISFFIDTCVLNHTEFDSFLNLLRHKHKLFHKWSSKTPCCECINSVSIAAPNKGSVLNESQLQTIYNLDGQEISGHVITSHQGYKTQHCLCKVTAISGITTENLDIALVHCLIKTCDPAIFARVGKHIEVIRRVRNELAHPSNGGIMSEQDFNNRWSDVENAVLAIAKEVSTSYERHAKKLISPLKNTDVNLKDVIEKVESSEDIIKKQFKDILEEHRKINGLLERKAEKIKREILGALEKQKDELSIEIKKLTFAVKFHGTEIEAKPEISETLYTREEQEDLKYHHDSCKNPQQTQHDERYTETCQVEWRLATPDTWKVDQIKQTLENVSQMLRQWFHIEFIYVGSLVIHTSVPKHVIRDKQILKSAIKSFLEKIVEVCKINTDITQTVTVDFKVLDMIPYTEVKSEVERLIKLPLYIESVSSIDEDSVSCKHCHKQFSCDQCSVRRKQIGFLVEDNRRKTQTLTDMEVKLVKTEPDSDDNADCEFVRVKETKEHRELGEPPYKKPRFQGHAEVVKSAVERPINLPLYSETKSHINEDSVSFTDCNKDHSSFKMFHIMKKQDINVWGALITQTFKKC